MEAEPVASAASGTLEVFKPVQLSHPPGSRFWELCQAVSTSIISWELGRAYPATNSTLLPKP